MWTGGGGGGRGGKGEGGICVPCEKEERKKERKSSRIRSERENVRGDRTRPRFLPSPLSPRSFFFCLFLSLQLIADRDSIYEEERPLSIHTHTHTGTHRYTQVRTRKGPTTSSSLIQDSPTTTYTRLQMLTGSAMGKQPLLVRCFLK